MAVYAVRAREEYADEPDRRIDGDDDYECPWFSAPINTVSIIGMSLELDGATLLHESGPFELWILCTEGWFGGNSTTAVPFAIIFPDSGNMQKTPICKTVVTSEEKLADFRCSRIPEKLEVAGNHLPRQSPIGVVFVWDSKVANVSCVA